MVSTHDRFGIFNNCNSGDLQLGKHSEAIIEIAIFLINKCCLRSVKKA